MIQASGRKRVVISKIMPTVEDGRFPAKVIQGQAFDLSANIFTDGHDEIAAEVQVRRIGQQQWQRLHLYPVGNDLWKVSFIPTELGLYEFQMTAWIDHYTTWYNGLKKKHSAGQDISVELEIGKEIIEVGASMVGAKQKSMLLKWAETLASTGSDDAVDLAGNEVNTALLRNVYDKDRVTNTPITYTFSSEREKVRCSAWYEIFPRSTSTEVGKHGNFKDVKRLLPRISRMGFDILYLPPIHPIGEKNRKGKNNSLVATATDPGSPWAIGNKTGGHKAIHPLLGTLKDFKDLIAASKKHGIEIAMDIALQCAPDHPYVALHPEWFKWRPDGTVQYAENPPKRYEDILPFYFETSEWRELWQELKSIFTYWIGIGIEIFRVDNPHTKSLAFWEWAIKEIKAEHPQVIFLAEAFTRPRIMERLAKAGFTQSYTYFTWRNTKKELEEYMTELTKTDLAYYFQPNFWPNTPDILPPELTAGGENNHIIRLILAATLSSSYGLYGPVYEFGLIEPMTGKEEYNDNEKYEIRQWNWDAYTKIKEVITRVNRIRKENVALQATNNIVFAETTNERIICYVKFSNDFQNVLIMVINIDPHNTQSGNIKLPMDKIGKEMDDKIILHDLLGGDRYEWKGEWNYVELNPYDMPAHILKVQ